MQYKHVIYNVGYYFVSIIFYYVIHHPFYNLEKKERSHLFYFLCCFT